ncbi:MAG TPA: EAL domain-containing protein [Paenibacillus sp.]
MLALTIASVRLDNLGISAESIRALLILAGLVIGTVSFAIFAQGWILFADKLSRQRLYTAVLFFIIGLLDVLHISAYSGIELFGIETGLHLSDTLLAISHLLGALGILFIFSSEDQQVSGKHKLITFIGGALVTVIGIGLLYTYQWKYSTWHTYIGRSFSNTVIWMVTLPTILLAMISMIRRARESSSSAAITMVRALMFMLLGHTLFMLVDMRLSLLHAVGEWYMVISYYFVMKGVYRLTIEEPFRSQQAVEAMMKHMVDHDELTGLPNLRRMKEELNGYANRSGASCIGITVINIDRFKAINDSLGYSAGDKMLTEVGERLSEVCQGAEKVYRMSEDEFAVILTDVSDAEAAERRAINLLRSVNPSVIIDDTEYHISLSMGLSVYPVDGTSVEQVIQYADMAVHHAKDQGQEFSRYVDTMKLVTQARIELENDMRKALDQEQFFLEFQPQFSLQTNRMVGMEALVRWRHPKRGIISPGDFIPIAEDSGLIVQLGEWVLKTACQYNRNWQLAGYPPICISVNLSMRQFRQYNLAERVGAILNEVGMEAKYLELEVTESMTYDIETALSQLYSLKQLGIHISIDDFGTGYSSLYYLKSLPIDRLKIDRAFVQELMLDGNDAAIVSTITTMAHHLQLKVTAEGVESKEQLEFLKQQNCHEGQGFLFSKPVPAGVFENEFLSRLAG